MITVYDLRGRLVAAAPLANGSVSLPAGSPAGVYAVQVGTLGSTLIRIK
ncbi:MAG: T9SS type A sorting domain-containing protein [Bacteroidaceae bacterium]|nr:T9SS type A sorting domain-containing protein [Bacteroidaceae bacterium]